MLELAGLYHRFGELVALDEVSLTVGAGEVVGLVGRDGAGKTTAIRAVMGIGHPKRGSVTWRGHPAGDADRMQFGYMLEAVRIRRCAWTPRCATSRACTA